MGSSYSNYIVSAEQKRVVGYLRYARRRAFVSPTENGACVVCEPLDLDFDGRAEDISRDLKTVVLAVINNDDDYFSYSLWEMGELLDEHRSPSADLEREAGGVRPDEWSPDSDNDMRSEEIWDDSDESGDDEQSLGDASLLCAAFGHPENTKRVANILSASAEQDKKYALSSQYHWNLIPLLGLPRASYIASFEILSHEANRSADEEFAHWTEVE